MRSSWRYTLLLVLSLLLPAVISSIVGDLARKVALDLTELRPWFFDVRSRTPDTASILTVAAMGLAIYGLVLLCLEGGRAGRVWLLPGLSILSSGVLLAICAVAFVRFWGRPAMDAYIDELRNATHEIPPPGVECLQPVTVWPATTHPRPGTPARPLVMRRCPGADGIRMSSIGGLGVLQVCDWRGCQIELAPSVEDLQARPESRSPDPVRSWPRSLYDAPFQNWEHALRFALEPSGRVLFIQDSGAPVPASRRAFGLPREFHLVEGRWRAVDFSAERVAEKTSAPAAWLWTGLAGLVVSGMLHALRRRIAARRRVLEAARPAVLGEDGRLTLENGTVARMEPSAGVPSGAVLVLREPPGSAYRDGVVLSTKDVLAGSLEDRLAKLRFDLLRCDAATVAVACLAAAPLGGAAMIGLLV